MDRCNYDQTQQLNELVVPRRNTQPFPTSSWSTICTSPHRIMSSNYVGAAGDSNQQRHDATAQATSQLMASLHSSSMQQWHSLQHFVDSFGIKSNLSELHSATFLPRSISSSSSIDERSSSADPHHGGHDFERSTSLNSLTSGFSSSRGSLAPPNSPVQFEHHESMAYQIAYAQRPPGMALRPRMTLPHAAFSPRKSTSCEEMLVSSTSGCVGGAAGGRFTRGGFGGYGQPQPIHPTMGAIGGHRSGVSPPTQPHYVLRDGPPLPPVAFNTSTTTIIPNNSVVGSSGGGQSVPLSSIPPVHNRNYQEARYKTELCLHYREKNACPHGAHCLFAHGLSELRPYRGRHPKHKSQPCKSFHETGYCNYGYRCSYIHLESPGTIRYIKSLNDEAQKQRKFNKQQLVSHREHYHRY